jgi:hypothetical protein
VTFKLYIMDESTYAFYTQVERLFNNYRHLFVGYDKDKHNKFTLGSYVITLDDFLTTSRISNEKYIPVQDLESGQKLKINSTRPAINNSVENYKSQLRHLIERLK